MNHWVNDGERFDLTFAGIEIPVLINTSELFMHVVSSTWHTYADDTKIGTIDHIIIC